MSHNTLKRRMANALARGSNRVSERMLRPFARSAEQQQRGQQQVWNPTPQQNVTGEMNHIRAKPTEEGPIEGEGQAQSRTDCAEQVQG